MKYLKLLYYIVLGILNVYIFVTYFIEVLEHKSYPNSSMRFNTKLFIWKYLNIAYRTV